MRFNHQADWRGGCFLSFLTALQRLATGLPSYQTPLASPALANHPA